MRELTLTVDDALWDELEAEGPTVAEAAARRLVQPRRRPAWQDFAEGLTGTGAVDLANDVDAIYRERRQP